MGNFQLPSLLFNLEIAHSFKRCFAMSQRQRAVRMELSSSIEIRRLFSTFWIISAWATWLWKVQTWIFDRSFLKTQSFFGLPDEVTEYLLFSALVSIDLSVSEVSWFNNELPLKLGGLLFDTALDGDVASTFHARCDNEGPTVTIVETTTGTVFGGYTDVAWASSGGWGADSDAFLFRLRPTPMKKFLVGDSTTAMYRLSTYGPWFGNTGFRIHTYAV